MQGFIHAVTGFFAPKAIRLIKSKNECKEIVYIEIPDVSPNERREYLKLLHTKCRRLVSFVSSKHVNFEVSMQLSQLIDKIQHAMYTNDDTTHLFCEFDHVESKIKKSSKSRMNLSMLF